MKKVRQIIVTLILVLVFSAGAYASVAAASEAEKTIDIVFLHDMHSYLENFVTVENGENKVLGGIPRIKTLVEQQRVENPDTLILDAGDFSMGTLVQTVYETEAAELKMLGDIYCDVTTFGNHEFDYKANGIAQMLQTAAVSETPVPAIVFSNVDWETMEAAGLTENQKMLKQAFDIYGVKDYVVLQKGDVRVAVIGIFGKDAAACVANCDLVFKDPVAGAKEVVAEIEANEAVDMIVCVSHSGTWADPKKSEDEILAQQVPEIDLIISGHTHTCLEKPIVYDHTYIASCGEYGKRLGSISMSSKGDGTWEMENYELIEVNADIPADAEAVAKIEALMDSVDTDYLGQFGYHRKQVLANNDIVFSTVKDLESIHEEHNLGNLIADAYKYAVEQAADFDGNRVDVAVAPSGTIRGTYATGDITVTDVFNSFSLGIGEDGVPGHPLLSIYLTGEELKLAVEIDASLSDLMTTARLYNAGICFTYNPNRLILNKATDMYLLGDNGERVEIEDDKLYRIVTDMYSGQMLGGVTDLSMGLLSLELKHADGTPIEKLEDAIIYVEGEELKAWTAIASYMESFEDTDGDGIGNVPQMYAEKQGRKVVEDSKHIVDLLKNPNRYAVLIIAVVVFAIIVLGLFILFLTKLVKRIAKRKNTR